jgi:tight adherence protein B
MIWIVAATFVLCATIILGIYWAVIVRPEDSVVRGLRRRLARPRPSPSADNILAKKEIRLSALHALDAALARSGRFAAGLKASLEMSGKGATIGALLLACGFVGSTVFFITQLLTTSVWIAAGLGMVTAFLPYLYVRRAATKRLRALEEQLPQAVDMIAVSLRAGHAFTTGMLMVADDLPNPLGGEFRLLYDQQTYGKPLPDVLRDFAARVPLLDARIFVTAVLTQRETGGNLAEVLDKLSAVIRERFRIRRQVRAMSAHGRVTGWVLTLLPPVLACVLLIIAPAHIRILIDDPLGRQMVAGAIGLQLIGTIVIRRIVNIEF